MPKIQWEWLPTTPHALCVGEQKTLTQQEAREINALLRSMWQDNARLTDLFNQAQKRFQDRPL